MAGKKKPVVSRIVTPTELPPAASAAAIALAMCKFVKVDTWAALEAKVAEEDEKTLAALVTLRLDEEQAALVNEHAFAVRAVGATSPLRTVAVCDTCGSVLVVSGAGAPKKCSMTPECPGTVHRASAATRVQA